MYIYYVCSQEHYSESHCYLRSKSTYILLYCSFKKVQFYCKVEGMAPLLSTLYLYFKGCIEGEVRLLEGTTPLEGRVEICKNNMWGTVCHTAWTTTDARVVCRQLGFSVAGERVLSIIATFGHQKKG